MSATERDGSIDLTERLKRIKKLTDQMLRPQTRSAEVGKLAEQISQEIQAARKALRSSKS